MAGRGPNAREASRAPCHRTRVASGMVESAHEGTSRTARMVADRAVVLLSGGLDGATVLAAALASGLECWALSFDYGQRHVHELDAARALAASMGAARHVVLPLDLRSFGGSALTGNIAVPKDRSESQMSADIPVTYVPARNLVFLSIAAGLAEVAGAGEIPHRRERGRLLGVSRLPAGVRRVLQAHVDLGTKGGVEGRGVRIVAPLVKLSKAQIIRLGAARLGVNFGLTHSCYDPVVAAADAAPGMGRAPAVLACGRCDSCLLRAKGFADAGLADPTRYAAVYQDDLWNRKIGQSETGDTLPRTS